MTNKDFLNISRLETFLNSILDNKVSKNTFFGSLSEKETIPNNWKDICLVEIPNGIEDYESYGKGTVFIWLYARPLPSGRKNVSVMSSLETKLNEVISNNSDTSFQMTILSKNTYYDNQYKWHCNLVKVLVKIY